MKHSPRFFRSVVAASIVAAVQLVTLPGCGQHGSRPASALSARDRTTLEHYETIRAALAVDDLRAAKRAAKDLGAALKPSADAPSTPLDDAVQQITDATMLDKARVGFKTLSDNMVTLTSGVEGFYVMDSPVPVGAEWVQTTPKVDNPYVGKPMRDVGTLRK